MIDLDTPVEVNQTSFNDGYRYGKTVDPTKWENLELAPGRDMRDWLLGFSQGRIVKNHEQDQKILSIDEDGKPTFTIETPGLENSSFPKAVAELIEAWIQCVVAIETEQTSD